MNLSILDMLASQGRLSPRDVAASQVRRPVGLVNASQNSDQLMLLWYQQPDISGRTAGRVQKAVLINRIRVTRAGAQTAWRVKVGILTQRFRENLDRHFTLES